MSSGFKIDSPLTGGGGGALVTEQYDYVKASYPTALTEVYQYYYGGSGGTLVATVTVTYVDDTKIALDNVART